ncbi:FecR family protein [Reichenbachiella sp. MALMAid0571]|uniref:FecR family protein n=1 Tax=Reichenbachiella sp. MALMAid0571 TaxID=3143939 RepID=UPI0032DFEF31
MKKKEVKVLFQNYITGKLSDEDFLMVDTFLKKGQHLDIWEEVINEESIGDRENSLNDIAKYTLLTRILSSTKPKQHKIRLWSVFKYAAIILLSIGFSWFAYDLTNEEKVIPKYAKVIEKSNEKGRKTTFNLPDGTIVKLNSNSSLRFPEYFDNEKREVILEGEAFFEVTKNKNKPFIIRSGDITTTVLGTSFNVNASPGSDKIEIAVVTGKVKVENTDAGSNSAVVYLEPNKKAVYNANTKSLNKMDFLAEEDIAWKDGVIIFKHAGEPDVIKRLEEWYGVDISMENRTQKKWDLNARFENSTLEHVLKVVGHQIGFDFKIKDNNVILKYENI